MRVVSLQSSGVRGHDGANVDFVREPFDSEAFGVEIGRIRAAHATSAAGYRLLFKSVLQRARAEHFQQVLRRTRLENLDEIWALEATGFELMDVVVTFARSVAPVAAVPTWPDLEVKEATDDTFEVIALEMVEDPWGSRYEADPAYDPARVRRLRRQWLTNSYRGRAAAFFVGIIDERAAGYVTCVLHDHTGEGELELVGTLPEFRGRRVATRVIERALAWFGERCRVVTVRTQATNIAAANLYERAGFTLRCTEATFRANVATALRAQP
jgi:ribosomal protein S18 acetylase RimI-like enzyme